MQDKAKKLLGISDRAYERRRHASGLAAWINRTFQKLHANGQLEYQYFERRGRSIKRLIEEAVPLSRLGLYHWTHGNEPYITLKPDGHPFDALLEVEGFASCTLKIEVTTCETEESVMRRQALSREGTVSLSGPIRRNKREIIATPAMVEVTEREEEIVALALRRLADKAESGRYDANTAVLVYVSEYWPLSAAGRCALHRRTLRYLETNDLATSTVYYCYWPDYSIDAIKVRRPHTTLAQRGHLQGTGNR